MCDAATLLTIEQEQAIVLFAKCKDAFVLECHMTHHIRIYCTHKSFVSIMQ